MFGKLNDVSEVIMSYSSPSEVFSIVKDPSNSLIIRSPKEYTTQLISGWVSKYPDFNLVDSIPTILSGKIAHKIVWNYTEGQNKLIDTQIVSNNGGNTFIIRYASLAQDYSNNISTILKIIRSFKFINEDTIVDSPGFLTYEDPVAGITMQYKSDWERRENSGILPLSPVVSFSPIDSDRDKYREEINLYIQRLPSNFSPQNKTYEYIDSLVRSSLSSSYEIDKIFSPVLNSSTDYGWYLLAYPARTRGTDILVEEIWKIIDDKLYRIELLCELGKCIKNGPLHLKMIGSLSIHPPDSSRWNFLTYDDPSSGIRTQYPIDWKSVPYNRNQLKEDGNIVEFWPPVNNTDLRGLSPQARVDISIHESESNITIDEFADNLVRNHQKQSPSFRLLEMNSNTSFSGLPAFKFIFSERGNTLQGMVAGTIFDGAYYQFYFVSTAGKFDTYLPEVTQMIKSFDIGLER